MKEKELDLAMLGAIKGILSDHKLYYHSNIGNDYCHLTDSGKAAVAEIVNMFAPRMIKAHEETLDNRAKELVLKELKS